jgi:hypothetical protein
MKNLLFLAIMSAILAGCSHSHLTKLSTLDTEAGETAIAYHGKLDDLMEDLRLLMSKGGNYPLKVDEGIKKGYVVFSDTYKVIWMLVPVRGITANGVEVNAYAIENTVISSTPLPSFNVTGLLARDNYKTLKKVFESKYPVVRVRVKQETAQ